MAPESFWRGATDPTSLILKQPDLTYKSLAEARDDGDTVIIRGPGTRTSCALWCIWMNSFVDRYLYVSREVDGRRSFAPAGRDPTKPRTSITQLEEDNVAAFCLSIGLICISVLRSS